MRKLYLALAAAPLPVGIISHYMRPINMAPRVVSEGKYMMNQSPWNTSDDMVDIYQ